MPPATPAAALVREPAPTIVEGELTYLERQPVDLARLREQHGAYVEVLRGAGLEIVTAPAAPAYPDAVFVEDAVVVVDGTAVLARSGAASRRGEADSLRTVLSERGLTIAEIVAPGTLDGGDVLQVDDTLYVGRSRRTDDAAIGQLRQLVTPLGRRVVPVTVGGALHLKTAATALPDGRIIADPAAVDVAAFDGRRILGSPDPSGCDVLLLGDTVVLAASAPRTAAALRAEGFDVLTVDIGELEKLEAGPTCPCVLLPPAHEVRAEEPTAVSGL